MRIQDLREDQRRLKTQRGSIIKRSKYGVGKDMGGRLYVHKDYADRLPFGDQLNAARMALMSAAPNFNYNAVSVEPKTGKTTFIEAPDFDSAPEPTVGRYITVDKDGNAKPGTSNQIWHHKWLWVDDDYKGFDVDESFQRSKAWLGIPDIDFKRIGNRDFWDKTIAGKL